MNRFLLIGLLGAIGSLARYAIQAATQRPGEGFPIGTLVVNVVGCLAIGVLATLATGPTPTPTALIREEWRLPILVGLLGGFTTFSSFGFETIRLIDQHHYGYAAANVLLSNALGLIAVWVGVRVTEHYLGA